jgi:integrase
MSGRCQTPIAILILHPIVTRARRKSMTGLSVKAVEAAKPGKARRELPDMYMKGLYLIIQPGTGTKTWAVRYRLGGKSHKHTIGPYPAFSLKQARDAAAKVLRSVSEGHSPKQRQAGTVADAVDQFLARHCKNYRPKTLYEVTRRLQTHVVDDWGTRRLDSVIRADVRAMLDGIVAPAAANLALGTVRTFFNWGVENDLIANSPVFGVRAPNKETPRDRVLTDDELKAVWRATGKEGYPLGSILQLLILTGQRRGEVTGMQWSELDLVAGTWTLPRERVKNDRRHEVPLARQAIAVINVVPRIGDKYVFTLSGTAATNNFKAKKRLNQLAGIEAWTLHDLRRTAASGMAKLGASLVVIEKVLNHVSGSLAGIVGVYQRHEYADEKRAALQLWADYVERLVR